MIWKRAPPGSDNGRCRQHNRAVDGNRDDVPREKTHSRLSRQCPVPPCCPGSGMAGATRIPDQPPFHSDLLPAPQSDPAVMGFDASTRDPQSVPRDLQRLLSIGSAFLTPGGTEKLGRLL